MARKNRSFSFEVFDSPDGAYTIFENSLRSGMEYDANIEDQFDAVVLTRPVKVTSDMKSVSFTPSDNGRSMFAFMVRILGDKSPHKYLPDPCLLTNLGGVDADGQRRAFNLIQQHTKVIMHATSDNPPPEINNIVRVSLERNRRGSFKTDVTKQFIEIIDSSTKPQPSQSNCEVIMDLFKYKDITAIGVPLATAASHPFDPSSLSRGGGTEYLNAGALFNYISEKEGNINSYNTGVVGGVPTNIPNPKLSESTVSQVLAQQKPPAGIGELFAVGKYQIIPDTMMSFLAWVEINTTRADPPPSGQIFYDPSVTIFNEAFQDLFVQYVIDIKRPAVGGYLQGFKYSVEDAALALAQEFASIGVPYDIAKSTYGSHPKQDIVKNQTFYPGGGNNAAHTPTEGIQEALKQARKANGHPI